MDCFIQGKKQGFCIPISVVIAGANLITFVIIGTDTWDTLNY